MILYKKEPYNLQMKNIMLLDDVTSGGVVYVSKNTYDQALLLSSRFDGNVDRVLATLKNYKTEVYIAIPGLKGLIDTMIKTMPEPLNMLAPFLVFAAQNQGISWDDSNIEMGYGILHQYSQLVDFNAVTLVPAEVRSNIVIPTGILTRYEDSWNDLCISLEEKVVKVEQPVQVIQPVQMAQPVQQVIQPVPTPEPVVQQTQPAPVQSVSTPAPSTESKLSDAGGESDFIARLRAKRQASEEALKKEQKEKAKNNERSVSSASKPESTVKEKALMEDKAAKEKEEINAILDDTDF